MAAARDDEGAAILAAGTTTDPALRAFVEEVETSVRANLRAIGIDDENAVSTVAKNLAGWVYPRIAERDQDIEKMRAELDLAGYANTENEATIAALLEQRDALTAKAEELRASIAAIGSAIAHAVKSTGGESC